MSQPLLLAFHLGPIQDFIATARRTQDLWIGSWLLAYLSQTAIKTALCKGAGLVLPKELIENPDPAIADTPNHFLARIKDGNAADIAQQAQTAIESAWFCIHRKVKSEFFGSVPDDLWRRQLEKFLEIYWAIVADDSSQKARNFAQTALDARKRLRDFRSTCEPYLKCTLCGARQELSGETTVPNARGWWQNLVASYLKRPHLEKLRIRKDGNERLCAVCAVKRAVLAAGAVSLHVTDGHFPSTSSVASVLFVRRLLETGNANEELKAHFKELEDIDIARKVNNTCLPGIDTISTYLPAGTKDKSLIFDGDVFYTETFTEERIADEYPEANAAYADFGATSLRTVYRAAEERPSKYFAALMMDGDHMGEFFGKATEKEAQDLSSRLSEFAHAEAKRIVESHFGRLVYAGGDDALALLPLERVLPCACELQKAFKRAISKVQTSLPRPTPSIGLAIAHHTQLLDATLSAMRQAERDAKNRYGCDALCVYVLKRSGEEVRAGTHWKDKDGKQLVELAEQAVSLLHNDVLSMKFPYVVSEEARALTVLPLAARKLELIRLAKRHKGSRLDEKLTFELAERVAAWADVEHGSDNNKKPLGLEEVAQWLLLARFIASGGRDDK